MAIGNLLDELMEANKPKKRYNVTLTESYVNEVKNMKIKLSSLLNDLIKVFLKNQEKQTNNQ